MRTLQNLNLILFAILSPMIGWSQISVDWGNTVDGAYGSSEGSMGTSNSTRTLGVDDAGNSYISLTFGSSEPITDADPGPSTLSFSAPNGETRTMFGKYDPNGNLLFAQSTEGGDLSVHQSVTDSQGNTIMVGYINEQVDMDMGNGVSQIGFSTPSTFTSDFGAFIAKYDPNGQLIFASTIFEHGTYNLSSIYFSITGLTVDVNDNIHIVGGYYGILDFGFITLNNDNAQISLNGGDMFEASFDSDGNFIDAFDIKNTTSGMHVLPTDIISDESGNLYISYETNDGTSNLGVDSWGSTATIPQNGILVYNPGGLFQDFVEVNINIKDIDYLNGHIYLVGDYYNSSACNDCVLIWQNPNTPFNTVTADGYGLTDIYCAEYNITSNEIENVYGFGGVNNEWPEDITIKNGTIRISGGYENTINFDPSSSNYSKTSVGNFDGFYVVIDSASYSFNSAFSVGGVGDDWIEDIRFDSNDNLYTYGIRENDVDLSTNSSNYMVGNSSSGNGMFWAKYSTGGTNCNLQSTSNVEDVSCYGLCDGSSTVSATNGDGNYSYQWNDSNAQTGATASSLCPGTYICTITDGQSCVLNDTVVVMSPDSLIVSTNIDISNTDSNNCDGSISSTVNGGTSSYSYEWLDCENQTIVGSNDMLNDACPGSYSLIVTDINGCVASSTCDTITDSSLGININEQNKELVIYPNPSNGVINVVSPWNEFSLIVYDALGKTIFYQEMNSNLVQLDLTKKGLNHGIYVVKVTSDSESIVRKISIE